MSRPSHHQGAQRATTADEERLGSVIDGRYRLDALVGRGGMGVVYRGEHIGIGRTVALKLLHPSLAQVPELRSRFEREARAIGVISHPNCVDVSDFGELPDGSLFLVMEFLEGKSLGDVLDRERVLDPRRALRILRGVLAGLGHAHQAGIVHRDVKPENVFLVREGADPEFPKILDFGIAKLLAQPLDDGTRLTQAGVAFGTPVYMSPEQALGNPVDARADLYAASVMAYEMICGKPPFYSDDKLEVLSMHTARPVPAMDEMLRSVLGARAIPVPPAVEQVILGGLVKRPEQRWQTADQYIAAIDDVLVALTLDEETTDGGKRPLVTSTGRSLIAELAGSGASMDPEDLTPTKAILAAPPRPGTARSQPIELPRAPSPPGPGPTPTALVPLPAPQAAPAHGSGTRAPTRGVGRAAVSFVRERPRVALGVGAGLLALLVIVVVAAAGGEEPPRAPPSEAATEAAAQLDRGDPAAAIKELEQRKGEIASDPQAQLQLGHAHAAKREYAPALLAYRRALELDPFLESNPILRANLATISNDSDTAAAMAAYEILLTMTRDGDAKARLLAAASSEQLDRRRAAVALVERLGLGAGVDWLTSYVLDLEQGETCVKRKEAIAKLRALRDDRAIPPLEQAILRKGKIGKTRNKPINKCLVDDARAAITFLHGLRAAGGDPGVN